MNTPGMPGGGIVVGTITNECSGGTRIGRVRTWFPWWLVTAAVEQQVLRQKVDHERWGFRLPGSDNLIDNRILPLATRNREQVIQEQERVVQLQCTDHLLDLFECGSHQEPLNDERKT